MTDVSRGYQQDAGTDFSLGSVFGLSSSILGAHFAQFAILGGIASLPVLVIAILFPDAAANQAGVVPPPTPGMAIVALLSVLLILPMMLIAQAMILFGAFQDMLGRPVKVLPSMGVGLARILPIIAMAIVQGAGIMLGFALLIIPGIVLALAWSVALPACVVEKIGPIDSLRRSAALTKGHRWKLLGIYVTLLIVGAFIRGGGQRNSPCHRRADSDSDRGIRLAGALSGVYGHTFGGHLSRFARDEGRRHHRTYRGGVRLRGAGPPRRSAWRQSASWSTASVPD